MTDNPHHHPDQRIDRVLRGLRDVEAPAGMESRILQAARQRSAVVRQPTRRWRSSFALAALILLCGTASLLHFGKPATVKITTQTARANPLSPVVPETAIRTAHSTAPRPPARIALRQDAALHNAQAAASNAQQAASFPAPPMPLTDQEKLLLRLAHKSDPAQFAMLDPLQRESRNAADRADFQRFFEIPTPGDSK